MSRFSLGAGTSFLIFSTFWLGFAPGQEKDKDKEAKELDAPERVFFNTADGVKIQGTFYRSPMKGAPAVLMIPNIGEVSTKEKWVELAKTLQPNFSVLTFDFRGHGASVEIDPLLYRTYAANVHATKGTSPKKSKLDYKDIDKNSYPLFINDIAAAKSYLERTKNELGMCNVQNTIVIGVEQGATLAAIWANSEWRRYKVDIMQNFMTGLYDVRYEKKPEGTCISALVCLGITPKLGNRTIDLKKTLDYPCRQGLMPAAFVHGDGDPKDKESLKDKDVAVGLEKAIKGTGKKVDPKLGFTKAVEMKGAGKLRGIDLLTKSLNTAEGLKVYLQTVVAENPQEWGVREFVKNKYVWKVSSNPNDTPVLARVLKEPSPFPEDPHFPLGSQLPDAVDKNLMFDTYERFVGR